MTQRAAYVLMVDRSIDQRDHASESRGESLRVQVSLQELDEFCWRVRGEVLHSDLVGVHDSSAYESFDQSNGSQFLIAHDMGDNVFDRPAVAQAGGLPVVAGQRP